MLSYKNSVFNFVMCTNFIVVAIAGTLISTVEAIADSKLWLNLVCIELQNVI